MRALTLVVFLWTSARTWLPTRNVSTGLDSTISSNSTNKSVTIVNYIDSNRCTCDNRRQLCDLRCCCDSSCNNSLVNQWKGASQCKTEFQPSIESFYCNETLISFSPKLRTLNTSILWSFRYSLQRHILFGVEQCRGHPRGV